MIVIEGSSRLGDYLVELAFTPDPLPRPACDCTLNGTKCPFPPRYRMVSGCEHEHVHENLLCQVCRDVVIIRGKTTCLDCGAPEQVESITALDPGQLAR